MESIPFQFKGYDSRFFVKSALGKLKQKDNKEAKFNRVSKLAKKWNVIERKLITILEEKESQEAFACLLMAETGIRIGNEDSANGYVTKIHNIAGEFIQTFGISTLQKKHISFEDDKMVLEFLGKKAVSQRIEIDNPILIKYGMLFFNNNECKTWLNISDESCNRFVKKRINKRLSVKDFRTFCANAIAWKIYKEEIEKQDLPSTKSELNKEIKSILEKISDILGNTVGICKSAYISPYLVEFISSKRGIIIEQKAKEREISKQQREEKWKKMNEERVAKGLPRKYRKRRKRTTN